MVRAAAYLTEMMTVFSKASPMLSEVTDSMTATAMCTMRRSYGLSGPISCARPVVLAFSARNVRHLVQLGVLVAAIAVAVDDQPPLVAAVAAERRSDDLLQGLQRLSLATGEHRPVFAVEVDADAVGFFFRRRRQIQAHRVDHALDEVHNRSRVHRLPPAAAGTLGGPISQLVKYCCPIAQRLLTNQ